MALSAFNFISCCRTFRVTASLSLARASTILDNAGSRDSPTKRSCCIWRKTSCNWACSLEALSSAGSWNWIAAFTAPQASCPMTTRTLTFRWCTAYCSDANVDVARPLPATRMTKMSPSPWSKTISTGTRESEQPSTATAGNCLEINPRFSNALFSGRVALPIQNRALPRCSSASTSAGDRNDDRIARASQFCCASSMENPCQPNISISRLARSSIRARPPVFDGLLFSLLDTRRSGEVPGVANAKPKASREAVSE
mmetsp:Transcript_49155/g.149641  ORF Transcript_49155/g.149641 Transcript_49155/m.149641 type:complete len:256 (-) Transcript_49155:12-779(-)